MIKISFRFDSGHKYQKIYKNTIFPTHEFSNPFSVLICIKFRTIKSNERGEWERNCLNTRHPRSTIFLHILNIVNQRRWQLFAVCHLTLFWMSRDRFGVYRSDLIPPIANTRECWHFLSNIEQEKLRAGIFISGLACQFHAAEKHLKQRKLCPSAPSGTSPNQLI